MEDAITFALVPILQRKLSPNCFSKFSPLQPKATTDALLVLGKQHGMGNPILPKSLHTSAVALVQISLQSTLLMFYGSLCQRNMHSTDTQ